MTQNTQTTAERLFALIFENIGYTDGDDRTVATIAAEIDLLTAERDEARADLAKCGADLQYEFDNPGDSRRRIAELEAEVERLRPAAEAWEAWEAWRVHDGRDQVGLAKLYGRRSDAATRARAAKEAKP